MKTKTNQGFKRACLFLALTALVLSLVPALPQQVRAEEVLTPYELKNGTQDDLKNSARYKIDSDGKQLWTLSVPKTGCLEIYMTTAKSGYVSAELYRSPDAAGLPEYLAFPCTDSNGRYAVVRKYLERGTYYLRLPQNSYSLEMSLYVSENQVLANHSLAVSYCDNTNKSEFTYTADGTGYITLSQNRLISTGESYCVSFYDTAGNKLTDVISDYDMGEKIRFPVKQGKTYRIYITTLASDGTQYYQIGLEYKGRREKSGATKKKAVSVNFGKSVSGMVFAEDPENKADWYKISNTVSRQMILTYSGYVSSGGIQLDIYNPKGKVIGTYTIMQNPKKTITYNLLDGKTVPKGTYYLRVTKSRKQAAGIYSFKLN